MKKVLHTIAIVVGVVTGIVAVAAPIIVLFRHWNKTHGTKSE